MNAKYYKMCVFLRRCSVMKRRITLPFQLLSSGFLQSESYFPELPRKGKVARFRELFQHIMEYGSIEWHYFSYGLDIKGLRDKVDYLDDNWFMWKSYMMNSVLAEQDKTCILRDKQLFSDCLSAWGFPSPEVLGHIDGSNESSSLLRQILETPGDYFIKPTDGQCGQHVVKLKVSEPEIQVNGAPVEKEAAISELLSIFKGSRFLIQRKVEQHPDLNRIYPHAINTIRLVTVFDRKQGDICPFSAVLRVGANGNVVDNWAAGGLAVGIDIETGELKEYGFYKHGKGTKTMKHPDTGFPFKGFVLPFFKEAVSQAIELHRQLLPMFVIGWDIAITPSGIIFIEGNDNLEISINQEANGGLRRAFLKLC